ncbi:hypothetical protein IB270_33125 [Ensifer sp. ENS05]|uniref:hypothetical protein n=1 Tax=Ensifer sp. ENS05 TaxID=2769277 RepID=UPI00177C55E2|nr:hypothetical protein [Ensifer sp. ENS05]MBD9597670.1 hypothetical protein [Ensifer sp. ENS05]
MTTIIANAFLMKVSEVDDTIYTAAVIQSSDEALCSITQHSYQIEKLHRAISSRSKCLTVRADTGPVAQ